MNLLLGIFLFASLAFLADGFRSARFCGVSALFLADLFFVYYFAVPLVVIALYHNYQPIWAEVSNHALVQALVLLMVCQGLMHLAYALVRFGTGSAHPDLRHPQLLSETLIPYGKLLSNGLLLLAGASFVVGLVGKSIILVQSGGISRVLLAMSGGHRNEMGIEINALTQLAASFFLGGIALFCLRRILLRQRQIVTWAILACGVIVEYLTTGKRTYPLSIAVIVLFWTIFETGFRVRKRHLLAGFAVIPVVIGLFLLVRIVVPQLVDGTHESMTAVDTIAANPIEFYVESAEFTLLDFTAYSLERPESLLGNESRPQAMIRLNFEGLTYILPKWLWPSKPKFYQDMSHAAYTASTGESGTGFAIGWVGVYHALAHIPGACLGALILGGLMGCSDRLMIKSCLRGYGNWLVFYPLSLFTLFEVLRYGTLSYVWIDFYQKYGAIFLFAVWILILRTTNGNRAGHHLEHSEIAV